jgi:hypothetical protein
MKKYLIILGIVVCSMVGITIIKDQIIKFVVTTIASRITGAPVHMDRFSWDIFSSKIHISGFKMYNPSGFPKDMLVSCPEIYVIYDPATLFEQKRHFLLVDVELKEMAPTKNKEGALNVHSLKIMRQVKSSSPLPMQIDLFTLSIGKIVYRDYTIGTEPSVRVYDVNRNKSYKNISTAQQLALLMLAEPMKAFVTKEAEIIGVSMLTGVAAMPVAIARTLIGKDSVQQIIDASFEHAYIISLEVVKRMGRITKDDAPNGSIKADINGSMVALQLRKKEDNKTEITISARKHMFSKLSVAGGVLYEILDKLQSSLSGG